MTTATLPTTGKGLRLSRAVSFLIGLPPAYLCTALLIACAAAYRQHLLSPMLLLLIFRQAAPLGMASIGQALVVRCRSLDLSTGGVIAAVSYLLTSGTVDLPPVVAIAASLLLGACIGAFNGALITTIRASSVIVTLAVSMILSGIVIALSQFHSPGPAPELVKAFGTSRLGGVPLMPLVWLAILVPFAGFLRISVFGKVVDAHGANPTAASLSGLPNVKVLFLAHVVSGVMSAASGVMLIGFVGVGNVTLGQDLALNSLAAVILGGVNFGSGKGGMMGPAVASFMLMLLFNVLTSMGLGEAGRLMLQGVIIAAAAMAYAVRQGGVQRT
ncbi:ABC transporter permease [Herbaspirillum sp. GCM10030257]|uniref:ABC transporter permease n=1 Tax=Herbaspirillum sp. GCM10030257 TaxID=3273393 RepID=UPI0036095AC6